MNESLSKIEFREIFNDIAKQALKDIPCYDQNEMGDFLGEYAQVGILPAQDHYETLTVVVSSGIYQISVFVGVDIKSDEIDNITDKIKKAFLEDSRAKRLISGIPYESSPFLHNATHYAVHISIPYQYRRKLNED